VNWATFLFDQFIPATSSEKIIVVDRTGLFSRKEFTDLLAANKITFAIIHSTVEVLHLFKMPVEVIIADQSCDRFSIPGAVKTAGRMIYVDFTSLPFNIEAPLYSSLEMESLLPLLNYCSEFPQVFVHTSNVENILAQSLKTQARQQNQALEALFDTFIKAEGKTTIDMVLEAGSCWGQYVFNCYHMSEEPDLLILKQIDTMLLKFIRDGNLKNLAFEMLSQFKSVERICGYLKSVASEKKALICFDGMGWAEWCLLKFVLSRQMSIETIEKPIFSMLPSTTGISRAAIYAGGHLTSVYQPSRFNERKAFLHQFDEAYLFKNNEPITDDSLLGYNVVSSIIYPKPPILILWCSI